MVRSSIYCNWFSCHFWLDVDSDRFSSDTYTHDPHRAPQAKKLREFRQIQRNCQCKWLLVSLSASGTSFSSSGSPEKFLFYMGKIVTTALPNLVPPRHIDDCSAIHFLHWEFCDLLPSNHQFFPLWARLYQHVFCKMPSIFCCLQADIAMWVLRKVRIYTVLTRTWFHLCFRDSIGNSWEELVVSRSLGAGFLRDSAGLLSPTKFSLKSWSQSRNSYKSCNRLLCTSSSPSFLFLFSVSVGLCNGLHRSSSLVLPLLSGVGFSVYLLTSITEFCDEDFDEVGENDVEEFVDKPWTTNGTYFDILQSIFLMILAELVSREQALREFRQEASPSRISPILWHILLLLLLFAPRRWPSSPSSDSLMSSRSPTQQS